MDLQKRNFRSKTTNQVNDQQNNSLFCGVVDVVHEHARERNAVRNIHKTLRPTNRRTDLWSTERTLRSVGRFIGRIVHNSQLNFVQWAHCTKYIRGKRIKILLHQEIIKYQTKSLQPILHFPLLH